MISAPPYAYYRDELLRFEKVSKEKKYMQKLPIGIQSFEKIREGNYIYVDKTKHLLNLVRKKKDVIFYLVLAVLENL